ncbi:MAG TPA: biotin--[acetyl-CoA-carboxylase] ligase, partial [Bacteroidia bacterium]
WESEAGKNLTLSILLKPAFLKPDEQFSLSKAIALAVLDFVTSILTPTSQLSVERGAVKIKWPNDIYIGNKKVAGILIENSVSGNFLSHSVVGIGININQENFSAGLLNASSLKRISGKSFELDECMVQLCTSIEKRYMQLKSHAQTLSQKSKELDAEYLKNLYRFNELAKFTHEGETISAKITGVSPIGKLVLEKDNEGALECEMKEIVFL